MRKTSAPALNRFAMTLRSEDAGPRVATILVRRRRRISCGFGTEAPARAGGRPPEGSEASGRARVAGAVGAERASRCGGRAGRRRRLKHRDARLQRLHGCLIGRFGELDGPGRLVAGIDFEKACTIIAARQAIVGAADGELLFPRTHEGLAGPFAAAIVVDRVNVIEPGDEGSPQHGLAAAGGDVPPALGGPALVLLVTDRDADPVAGVVAKPEISPGRLGGQGESRRDQRASGAHASAPTGGPG